MAAWLGGSHGQPDELRGPGAAGAEEEGQAGGAPPGGWTRPCHGAGGAPWWGPAAIPRRAAGMRAARRRCSGCACSRRCSAFPAGEQRMPSWIRGRCSASCASAPCGSRCRTRRPSRSSAMPPWGRAARPAVRAPATWAWRSAPRSPPAPIPPSVRRTTARKPSAIEGLDCALPAERGIESRKASVRSGAEHPSLIAKRRSGHLKTRCRGVRKSSCMPCVSFAPADPAVRIPAGRSLASRPEAA